MRNALRPGYFFSMSFLFATLNILLYINTAHEQCRFEPDSQVYWWMSDTFMKTGSFDAIPGICTSMYTLGYPLFVTALRSIYDHAAIIIFAQIACILLVNGLIGATAIKLFGTSVLCFTLLFSFFNLGFFVLPHFVLSDVLFLFMVVSAFYWFVKALDATRYGESIFSGILWGAASLIKPAPLFFIPVLAVFFGIVKRRIKGLFIFVACACILPGIVLVRNYYVYNSWHFKSVDKINLYLFFLPKVLASVNGSSESDERVGIEALIQGNNLADVHRWERAEKVFLKTIHDHPFIAVRIWVQNIFKTLLGLYSTHLKMLLNPTLKGGDCSFFKGNGSLFERMQQYVSCGSTYSWLTGVGWFEVFYNALKILGVFLGFCLMLVHRRWRQFFLCGIMIGYFLCITGPDGCARLRLIADAVMMMVAGYGFTAIVNPKKGKKVCAE